MKQKINYGPIFWIVSAMFTSLFSSVFGQSLEKDSLRKTYLDFKMKKITLDKRAEVDLLNELARSYRFRHPDSLKYYAEMALSLSKNINYKKGIVMATVRQGGYLSDMGEDLRAQQKYKEAELLIERLEEPEFQIEFYKNISLQYFFDRQLRKTLETAYKAIDLARKYHMPRKEAITRHNLGFIYLKNKLHDEAHEELKISDSLSNAAGDKLMRNRTRSNLALNSILRGDTKKARTYLKGNKEFFLHMGEQLWLSRNFRVESQIALEEKNFESALALNRKSDSLLQLLNNIRDKLETLDLYTQIHFESQNLVQGKIYADSTLALSSTLNDSITLLRAFGYLKQIAVNQGDYELGAEYANLSQPIEKILDKRFKEDNLKLLRAKIELEYEQLEKELSVNKSLIRQQRLTLMIILLLGILLCILFLGRKLVQKRKLVTANLEELSLTKNRLFSIIGHDLKSPIATLQELLELYTSKEISEKDIAQLAPKLKENVDQSSFMLNNLLYWAKTQMSGTKPNPKTVKVQNAVSAVCHFYKLKIEAKNIQIVNSIAFGLHAKVDPVHLDIILRNMVYNAIKFTQTNGKIQVDAKAKNGILEVSICDSGIGMTKTRIGDLLSSRYVKPKMGTNQEKGTGLGLKISHELIKINQGCLEIKSIPNMGSCFKFILPVA